MLVKELIASLQEILYEYGNIRVILQGDEEGNSYESPRGAEVAYVDEEMEYCYDSMATAIEDGNDEVETIVVIYP